MYLDTKAPLLAMLAIAPALSTAFKIPQSQPDGVYLHRVVHGRSTHTKIVDIHFAHQAGSSIHSAKFRQRSDPLSGSGAAPSCGQGSFTQNDYNGALGALKHTCVGTDTVDSGSNVYVQSGSAVAYMCNYGGTNDCTAAEVSSAEGAVIATCGKWNSGRDMLNNWPKSYGFQNANVGICGS